MNLRKLIFDETTFIEKYQRRIWGTTEKRSKLKRTLTKRNVLIASLTIKWQPLQGDPTTKLRYYGAGYAGRHHTTEELLIAMKQSARLQVQAPQLSKFFWLFFFWSWYYWFIMCLFSTCCINIIVVWQLPFVKN